MSDVQRITITVTDDMAAMVRGAVSAGDYASSSEIIREALRDWKVKRLVQEQHLAEMRAFIAEGIAEIEAGLDVPFDQEMVEKIKAEGRRKLRAREG